MAATDNIICTHYTSAQLQTALAERDNWQNKAEKFEDNYTFETLRVLSRYRLWREREGREKLKEVRKGGAGKEQACGGMESNNPAISAGV